MEFFQAVSTTVCLHQQDFNEMIEKKARWKRRKDAVCCFELIQEAAPYKMATEWLLAFITQTILIRQTTLAGHFWRSMEEIINEFPLWAPTRHSSVSRPAETYSSTLYEHWVLARGLAKSDGR